MKITRKELRKMIMEEKANLSETSGRAFSPRDIMTNMGTGFTFGDEASGYVEGNLLNVRDLRALADALDRLYLGQVIPQGRVGFDID